jgi:glutaconate CoA-transferase subunit B
VAQASHATMIDLELRGRCDFQFLRPIQIDASGNINASLIGTLQEPRFRFHGLGLGDAIGVVGRICLYVTEHTPRVFTPTLAFRTGLGHGRGAEIRKAVGLGGRGPAAVVTPLGVLDFDTPDRTARLRATFPGVTPEQVQEQTGFELRLDDAVPFDPPSERELTALAEIDPHRMRRMEFREWRGEVQAKLSERRVA